MKKEFISGPDDDTYRLHYQSGDKIWKQDTSQEYYDSVMEGSCVLAVYLPGKKRPMLHYDCEGDAL